MSSDATQHLGYLIAHVCKAHRRKVDELLQSRLGLYAGQEMLLLQLWSQDGVNQSALADDLCIQPATLTRTLDRLERVGYVQRQPDPDDRRASRVYLTEAGRTLQSQIKAVLEEVEALTFANLTTEEQLLLRRLLMQIEGNLSK